MGRRKKPFYRIVVSDRRFPRDGRYIEQVGTYDPRAKTGGVKLNREKIDAWIKKGAQAVPNRLRADQERAQGRLRDLVP